MKYVIGEMIKTFAPLILIVVIFTASYIGTLIHRRNNPERAVKYEKPLNASKNIIIAFGGVFLFLFLVFIILAVFFGIPHPQ